MVAVALDGLQLGLVDWAAPWFDEIAERGRAMAHEGDKRAALNAEADRVGVRNAARRPIRFVRPDAAGEAAYEAHIGRTGEVPTRDNRHDFFNALMWLTFPRIKARLNALQAAAIAVAGAAAPRGPLRDAATLIDENAVLLVTERTDLVEALRHHDWHALFVSNRVAWGREIRAVVFGHALLDKLTAPYKGITAHALPVTLPVDTSLGEIDAWVGALLDERLSTRQLLPLPVLGIPGWADNQDSAYYDDGSVFRPARSRRAFALQSLRG